jgi:hypothetical protein
MSSTGFYYKFVDGDTIQIIAIRFGGIEWELIWKHEKNSGLRKMRKNHGAIKPGDTVFIPAVFKSASVPSGFVRELVVHPVTVKSLLFTDAITDIKINDTDWTNTGLSIAAATNHWDVKRSLPVVLISNNNKVKVNVELQVKGIAQTQSLNGEILSVSENFDLSIFSHFGNTLITSGNVTTSLESKAPLNNPPQKFDDVEIVWRLKAHSGTNREGTIQLGSTLHDYYIVYGPPIKSKDCFRESGATTKRLTAALEWIRSSHEIEPVKIVEKLFKRFSGYILNFEQLDEDMQKFLNDHPDLKKKLFRAGFPAYMNPDAGAWSLIEYEKYSGECQSIVRLIAGIMHQVGFAGTLQIKYITANAPNHKNTIINDIGIGPGGPDPSKKYFLVDDKVEVGDIYDFNGLIGFNKYEAYLKFSYKDLSGNDKIAWFGGGLGLVADIDASKPEEVQSAELQLIQTFSGLVECAPVPFGLKTNYVRITKFWTYKN